MSPDPTPVRPKAASPNLVHHTLTGRIFFLLPDEDPAEFAAHEAELLATYRPRDHAEREAVLAVVRAMWREIRGDRLEAQVLTDLFAAGRIEDQAQREAARARAGGVAGEPAPPAPARA